MLLKNNPLNFICVKNMYKELGMAFITIDIDQNFDGKVRILINHQELNRRGILPLNTLGDQLEYYAPYKSIIMFKLKGKFVEGDTFPPPSGIQVILILQNKNIFIWK